MGYRRCFFSGIVLFALICSEYADAQGFDFDNPNLDKPQEKKNGNDISLGSFGGLNLGVLFDVRYLVIGDHSPGTVIHVNELNITGNIGDNISILAEQLLPTSRLSGIEDEIGDDHGFVFPGLFKPLFNISDHDLIVINITLP